MAIQEQFVLSKESNGDVKLTQNSVNPFFSFNSGAIVNTLVLKEGNVGIGTNAPGAKLEIVNNLTGHGQYINQSGVLAFGKHALYVYSNAAQTNSTLAEIVQNNTSSDQRALQITNEGSGRGLTVDNNGNGTSCQIENAGTGQGLVISQDGVLATGKNGLYIYSGAAQVNAHLFRIINTNNSTTYDSILFDNDGTGTNLHIIQDGNLASSKYALYIDNNGTPVDGSGRALRFDGCTISSTKSPETDAEAGFLAVNIDGTQRAIPFYALS